MSLPRGPPQPLPFSRPRSQPPLSVQPPCTHLPRPLLPMQPPHPLLLHPTHPTPPAPSAPHAPNPTRSFCTPRTQPRPLLLHPTHPTPPAPSAPHAPNPARSPAPSAPNLAPYFCTPCSQPRLLLLHPMQPTPLAPLLLLHPTHPTPPPTSAPHAASPSRTEPHAPLRLPPACTHTSLQRSGARVPAYSRRGSRCLMLPVFAGTGDRKGKLCISLYERCTGLRDLGHSQPLGV
ncbi:hypothetical protein KIL84_014576 [Mauremys mutica]|uniref:Uncharacterized protein n=1 Tax=Mauremys mutica TaxID=74926 RepID=A0A9D4B849_9SAUR|nr:hypothetical protein KIL84_014576 [Mauremys mutica]